jgi:tRNA-specific adenosine deaminase 2
MNATNRSYNGTRHAEFMAISAILSHPASPSEPGNGGKRYSPEILKECDLYVTVEPCIMCASLLRQFGVRKVYYGATNEKFGGTGGVLNIHRSNGRDLGEGMGSEMVDEGDYEVSGGWLKEEAIVMLQRFYMQENERAPEPKARGKKGAGLETDTGVGSGVDGKGKGKGTGRGDE